MKITINYIAEFREISAYGVERMSMETMATLESTVRFRKFHYDSIFGKSFFKLLYIYFIYPFEIKLKLINRKEIIHLSNQGIAHLAYFFPQNKLVISCHDLIPIAFLKPQNFLQKVLMMVSFSGLKKAKKIIAFSHFTKNDLIRYLHIPKENITVIYPRILEIFKKLDAETIVDIKKSLFPRNKIVLYVGSYLPNKNLPAVFQAFHKIKRKMNNLTLVIVNEKSNLPSEYKTLIGSLNIEKSIHFTGYVSDQKLVELYNVADVFLFPSLYEGFGLPPLEAMACGCPVITSNTSSLPEVVGNAGIMVDPNDYNEIARRAINLLENPKIRNRIMIKGLKQAKKFDVDSSTKVLNVYRNLS